jgi:carbon storage regulator CsrA
LLFEEPRATEGADRWHVQSLLNGERQWGAVLSVVSRRKGPVMLVLSRRLNEKIVFPESNTVVQIVGVRPGVVRLGVRAPAEVRILREEVHTRRAEWRAPRASESPAPAPKEKSAGDAQTWLTSATLGLGLARLQLRVGRTRDAQETLARLHSQLQGVRKRLDHAEDRPSSASLPLDRDGMPGDACEFLAC